MKNIVVIGGGHGQATILRGLKQLDDINISAIVTVADNGGSTGRLKNNYNMPGVGDIRNVMIALAQSESLMASLMAYRFEGHNDVGGHALGNLILTAMTKISGDLKKAIELLSDVLNLKGKVIPSTTQVIDLVGLLSDGERVYGECELPNTPKNIEYVYYEGKVEANERAIQAIDQADYIIFSMGSLYTSLIPNIIIPEIEVALRTSKAMKLYFANVCTQPGETDNYSLEDHICAIEKHSFKGIVDKVIMPYCDEVNNLVKVQENEHEYDIIYADLLAENSLLHDSNKITKIIKELMKEG